MSRFQPVALAALAVAPEPGWRIRCARVPGPRRSMRWRSTPRPTSRWWRGEIAGSTWPFPTSIRLAKRAGGSWSLATLDTFHGDPLPPAIVARDGAVWVSWIRDDGADRRQFGPLMVTRWPVPDAGDPQVLDSLIRVRPSLSFDPLDQNPVVAYLDNRSYVSIGRRRPDGSWVSEPRWQTGVLVDGLSLAVDGFGRERVVNTLSTYFLRPPAPEGCFYVATGRVNLLGTSDPDDDPYDRLFLPVPRYDAHSGLRSLALSPRGVAHVIYASPGLPCTPSLLLHAALPIESWEEGPPPPPHGLEISGLSPNPRAGDRPLRIRITIDHEADLSLSLHDLTGRRVAQRTEGLRGPGVHPIEWNPGSLRPGLYWLAVEEGGRRLATRAWVVLR